jgi:PAS domain S-box-containing protein
MMKSHSISLAEMLTDASIDQVLAIDTNWKIVAWNKTAESVTGIPKSELLGKHLLEAFPQLKDDKDMIAAYQAAMSGLKSFLQAEQNLFNRATYENHFIPLRDDGGTVIGVMNIMHDVAHRIKAERQLQRLHIALKEKYEELEKATSELATFTSITGTDLKEPIRRVYTGLEMLIRTDGHRLSDGSRASLRRMQGSLNRMNLLLDDILALSTASGFAQQFTKVDLNELAREVLESLKSKISDRDAAVTIGNLPSVEGSRQMLHYLLYNLLDNALKFQPENQRPVIAVEGNIERRAPHAQSDKGEEQEFVCITVTDNGIGFAQEDADRIFTMFERLHPRKQYNGSGIGLTICRKIAQAHHGFLEVESEPARGSTFRCYLAAGG